MFEVESGISIDAESGKIKKEEPFFMASRILYRAKAGDRITVADWAFLLAVATYGTTVRDEYMYTYMYEEEQNWSCYQGDFSEECFSTEDYVFAEDCYFRICLKKEDGNWCTPADAERINEILSFHSAQRAETDSNDAVYFDMEVQKTADTVLEKQKDGKALVFALLSDSHYVTNGNWGGGYSKYR